MSELQIILKSRPEEKKKILITIGEKLSKSRKSSRKKLEGIAKKLNFSLEMLKDIEAGNISKFPPTIHITGFLRAFAEKVSCDISLELEQLIQKESSVMKNRKNFELPNKFSFLLLVFFLIFLISLIFILSTPKIKKEIFQMKTSEISQTTNKIETIIAKKELENIGATINTTKVPSSENFFEINFLEETWIEILDKNKNLLTNGLYQIGDSLKFEFKKEDSDFFIKSGNLGGFQIFYNEEFFAPFGLSGQVSKGFFLKEKINTVKNVRVLKNEY